MLLAIVFFGKRLSIERRITAGFGSTLAKIVRFERRGRRGRVSIYEYKSPIGVDLNGKGGSLVGFSVGMTVPVLYSVSNPNESLPVPDFIFHRIRAEQL